MQKYTVVYTDPGWALGLDGRVDPALASIEQQVLGTGIELRFGAAKNGQYIRSGPQFLSVLAGADALVIARCCINEEVLAATGTKLKVVCRQGVGFDNLAPDLLKAHGIIGLNIPDYCVDEVATHTLALLLALERGLITQHLTLTRGQFDTYAGGIPRRLQEYTAGVIGFGRIGRAVAARLRMFYKNVIACDPNVSSDLMIAHGVEKVDFENLLGLADAILLHCPLDNTTQKIVDAGALARMKPTALLINAARGGLIDPRALLEALEGKQIAGAGIDVFSPEDPHENEWYGRVVRHPNVVVTSHRAYLSRESEISQRHRAAEGILQVLETGRPPSTGLLT
jgi:phosphoglycerate dehydrogenase-like enzyme